MNDNPNCCNGWLKLYHPRGPQVTLPVAGGTAAEYFAAVSAFLDAGFLVDAPGLDAGEQKEAVGAVLHILHERDGEITPVIMAYSSNDRLEFPLLRVYLNNSDDIAAFEKASGLKLAALPVYEGDRLARDGSAKARRYIIAAPRPFNVVMKANPAYVQADKDAAVKANKVYSIPRNKFVRWNGTPSPSIENRIAAATTEAELVAIWNTLSREEQQLHVAAKDAAKAKLAHA